MFVNMHLTVLSLIILAKASLAVELPSYRVSRVALAPAPGPAPAPVERNADGWWIKLGDRVFHEPPPLQHELSTNISNYYLTFGSGAALTDDLKAHRVGGQGRWHILHLPADASMLEKVHQNGARRSSFSKLQKLEHGTVVSTDFPQYELDPNYVHPLDDNGQGVERAIVENISPTVVMNYLKKVTEFPTRSYSDAGATEKVDGYLQKQFEEMGFTACLHHVDKKHGGITNVVAHVPGKSAGYVVVGAHYDSRPFSGPAPGANDNGSGVAALLAIANAVSQSKVVPDKGIYFVAFGGEEPGLLGSAGFARALTAYDLKEGEGIPAKCKPASSFLQVKRNREWVDTHRALIMDEVGWKTSKYSKPTVNLESYDWATPELNHLRQASQMHNGDSLDIVHSSNPFGSDHMSFLDRQVMAVLSINGDDEAYPDYHKSSDRIGNVDKDLLSMVAKMNAGALMRMAGVNQ